LRQVPTVWRGSRGGRRGRATARKGHHWHTNHSFTPLVLVLIVCASVFVFGTCACVCVLLCVCLPLLGLPCYTKSHRQCAPFLSSGRRLSQDGYNRLTDLGVRSEWDLANPAPTRSATPTDAEAADECVDCDPVDA